MIEAVGLHKRYGDVAVLKGIDLSISKGEVVSIVGASGAGKTTLLQLLGTLDRPDSGSILYHGEDISKYRDRQLAAFRNQHIGFIFQFHQLLPEFNAWENVCLPGYMSKTDDAAVEKRAKELLEFLGLGHRIDHKPAALSGGEQQRVAVARSLINQPDIVFADEPSGNLDSKNAEDLHKLFFQLRDEFQQTFVIVTHNKELASMADRKIEMRDGRIN
jgi:lipoprotein-releasing system ATP-binding protein